MFEVSFYCCITFVRPCKRTMTVTSWNPTFSPPSMIHINFVFFIYCNIIKMHWGWFFPHKPHCHESLCASMKTKCYTLHFHYWKPKTCRTMRVHFHFIMFEFAFYCWITFVRPCKRTVTVTSWKRMFFPHPSDPRQFRVFHIL